MSDQGISIQNYNKYQSIDRLHSMEKALKETIDSFDKSEIILAVLKNPDYPFYITQIDAMLIAQDFSIDTINGYSGVFPIDYKMGGFNTREDVLHYAYKNSDFFLNKKIIIYSEESINIERILPHKTITPMNRELVESELLYSCSFVKKKEISDKKFEHFFKLTNNGNGVWNGLPDSDGRKQLSVSYRFLNNEKDPVTDFNPRINLPFDLYPGDSFIFSLIVDQKKFPERNFVEISLVQELTFWFQDKGIVTKIFSIE